MALKGTLKDFGIADIFQLISHQSKTGVLHLHSGTQEVRISFVSGDVVRAESTTRKKQDLLGAMLVRAEVITEAQLEESLEIQKRTLRRLGDVLVERGFMTKVELRQFTHLQTTETIYKLFNWESGTYAFEPEEVVYDKETVEPIRSESMLMEGFRMVDEWPMIRKRITSYEMIFKKTKELPTPAAGGGPVEDLDGALDEAFGEKQEKKKEERPKSIGRNEEKILGLVQEDRDVQKLIDLSRLGEFETCKALYNLLNEGFIKVAPPRKDVVKTTDEKPGGKVGRFSLRRVLLQFLMYLFIVFVLFLLYRVVDLDVFNLSQGAGSHTFQNPLARELVDRSQQKRLRAALEVFRMETGRYPEKLDELVQTGLVGENDLRFPWRNVHIYRRHDGGYVLLRPIE